MSRFVALLRGVNVGKAKRVPMAEFRALLETLGYTDVQTLLNSGNAVFNSTGRSTTAHAGRIRTAIAATLDVDVPVIVKSAAEVAAIVSENKLAAIVTSPSRLLVAFTGDAESLKDLAAMEPLVMAPEQIHLGKHALYFWCPDGIHESLAANALLGKPGREATTRNWATVVKITSLLQPDRD